MSSFLARRGSRVFRKDIIDSGERVCLLPDDKISVMPNDRGAVRVVKFTVESKGGNSNVTISDGAGSDEYANLFWTKLDYTIKQLKEIIEENEPEFAANGFALRIKPPRRGSGDERGKKWTFLSEKHDNMRIKDLGVDESASVFASSKAAEADAASTASIIQGKIEAGQNEIKRRKSEFNLMSKEGREKMITYRVEEAAFPVQAKKKSTTKKVLKKEASSVSESKAKTFEEKEPLVTRKKKKLASAALQEVRIIKDEDRSRFERIRNETLMSFENKDHSSNKFSEPFPTMKKKNRVQKERRLSRTFAYKEETSFDYGGKGGEGEEEEEGVRGESSATETVTQEREGRKDGSSFQFEDGVLTICSKETEEKDTDNTFKKLDSDCVAKEEEKGTRKMANKRNRKLRRQFTFTEAFDDNVGNMMLSAIAPDPAMT
eukprot:g5346.t1